MELQRNDPSTLLDALGRPSAGPARLAPKPSEVFAAVEQRTQTLANYVREKAQQQPYATVALGAAAGYVLGGGLTLRLTRFLLTNVARAAASSLVGATIRGAKPPGGRHETEGPDAQSSRRGEVARVTPIECSIREAVLSGRPSCGGSVISRQ